MYCKKCGNELKDDEKFCGKCGQKVNDEIVKNDVDNKKEPIKIKFTHLMIIIGIVIIIAGVAISMNISSNDGLMQKAQKASSIMQDNSSETNAKKDYFKIDNNSETGVIYNFTLQDIKEALDLVCKEKNRSNYTDFVYTDSNSYNKVYEAYGDTTNKDISVINVQTYNNYVTMITYQYSNIGAGYAELQGKEIFYGLIEKLFNNEYSSKIISILKELPNTKYKYYDRTLCSVIKATNLNINQITINSCSQKYYEQSKSAYPSLFE